MCDRQLIKQASGRSKEIVMNLTRAGIYRLVVQHKNRLERHYGGDQRRHFQARGLAILSLVFSAMLRVRIIAFLLIDTSLLPIQTKLVFLPLKLVMVAAFASYVALLNGRETLARTVVAITVVGGVMTAIVLTGGLPTSVAAPVLLLPTIIFFCLYGARGHGDGLSANLGDAQGVRGSDRYRPATAGLSVRLARRCGSNPFPLL